MIFINSSRRISLCILGITLFICLTLSGCELFLKKDVVSAQCDSSLQLSVVTDNTNCTSFSETDFINTFHGTLEYFQVTDVMIKIEEVVVPMEDAIRDGKITFHEIHCLAQKDACTGICYETVESNRGLTRFIYDYLSYKLIITNDIYETPDGKQHHIRNITVTNTNSDPVHLLHHLDQEDWGIEFNVENVTPSSITLNYIQSGGQLIGQLRTGNYSLSRTDLKKVVLRLDDSLLPEIQWIEHNTEGTISLDFEQLFGLLDSGEYLLYLYLHDDYDPDQVPPLIRNYHDIQCYTVAFSIP